VKELSVQSTEAAITHDDDVIARLCVLGQYVN